MPTPITITNFQKGIGASSYVGFGKMVNVDIFKKPGIIQPGVELENSGLTPTNLITCEIIAPNGDSFFGTYDGQLWKNGVVFQTGLGNVHDLGVVYDPITKYNYLIISSNGTSLALYGIDNNVWLATWKTGLETSVFGYKKIVVGQDNVVYIGNENKLANITGIGVVGTSGCVLNPSCFSTSLPQGRIVQTLCEYNKYIAIVTSIGNSSSGNTVIYFMDRGNLDPSQTTFSLSIGIEVPERMVKQMINTNNKLYFIGLDTGTLYTTNTVNFDIVSVIPGRVSTYGYQANPNAIMVMNGEIIFGITYSLEGLNSPVVSGVYSYKNNALITKNTISNGNYGQNDNTISIGSIYPVSGDYYHVTWANYDTVNIVFTYGLDIGAAQMASSAWFETPMYETGQAKVQRTFQTIQFNLGNNFQTGQSISVAYRTAISDSYSTPVVYDFATYGAVNSFHGTFSTPKNTNIQCLITLNSGGQQDGVENLQLQSIILE